MMQVAKITGRAIVWPDIHCNNTLFRAGTITNLLSLPINLKEYWMHPYGPYGQQKCFRLASGSPKCLSQGKGLTEVELEHLKHMLRYHQHQHGQGQGRSKQQSNQQHQHQHRKMVQISGPLADDSSISTDNSTGQVGAATDSKHSSQHSHSATGPHVHHSERARVHSLWMGLQPHLSGLPLEALEPGPANKLMWHPAEGAGPGLHPGSRTFLQLSQWQVRGMMVA